MQFCLLAQLKTGGECIGEVRHDDIIVLIYKGHPWLRYHMWVVGAAVAHDIERGVPLQTCMICREHEDKGEPLAPDLVGEVLLKRLDITLLQKPGKRVLNIEFAALCQMSHVCDVTLPIEEQE